jgi:hypothetical protein
MRESRDTTDMRTTTKLLILAPAILLVWVAKPQTVKPPGSGPQYTSDGQLRLPANYREWVYVSSGFDMSYNPGAQTDHHMFDNVFVNPEAWRSFAASGRWPDKTMLVLETRSAQGRGSINQKGNFQSGVMGLEVHVKDQARFTGNWAFFGFSGAATTAKMIPLSENCYSCHSEHGAVDTTFVQFYPTLLPIAQEKGTLAGTYKNEEANR